MITLDTIKQQISALKAERESFIAQANATVERYNGAIAVLEDMVKKDEDAEGKPEDE